MATHRNALSRLFPPPFRFPVLLVLLTLCQTVTVQGQSVPGGQVSGTLVAWHTVTVDFTGPPTSETATPNPFLDRRLDVTFTHDATGQVMTVPGFFAADGQASETGASAGPVWRARFTPALGGTWSYQASFRAGSNVSIDDDPLAGTPADFDGQFGSFVVAPVDPAASGFLREGRLIWDGGHYLHFAGSGRPFLKGGADSPENFLAFGDFDQTAATHDYTPHLGDWQPGDPTWKSGLGKGIVGALNYLAGTGMNSVYFLTFNVGGDGDDVWMWTAKTERLRFDVSKLAQWEIVFDHMDKLGLMLHVVTQETEIDNNAKALDGGALGTERKVYYRELVARFGHHLGVVWNLGEENTNTTVQQHAFYDFISTLDACDHPIVVHTYPTAQDAVYGPLLDLGILEGASLQDSSPNAVHASTLKWRSQSAIQGQPWVVTSDEIGPPNVGVAPDANDFWHAQPRKQALWGNLMAGGAGAEWYFGYGFPDDDLTCEDWRSRENMWVLTRIALQFFEQHLPFDAMVPSDQLVSGGGAWCFAKPGDTFAVYLPAGGTTQLNLGSDTRAYAVKWYDPRNGGELQAGSVGMVTGPGWVSLGTPPSGANSDWAVHVAIAGAPPLIVSAGASYHGGDIVVSALVEDPDGAADIVAVKAWFFAPDGTFLLTLPLESATGIWSLLLKDVPIVPAGDWPIAITATDASGQQDVFTAFYNQP